MKNFGILMMGLLISSGAYATDGCPVVAGAYSNCSVLQGNYTVTGSPTLTISQSVNASGQTVYQIHTENTAAGQAPSDSTVEVNGAITQTTSDSQGDTLTQVVTTTCSNQKVDQATDISVNGAAYATADINFTTDSSGNLVLGTVIKGGGQDLNVVMSCKKQ
jgi:hypothetical protein